jgi:hypothetical protein
MFDDCSDEDAHLVRSNSSASTDKFVTPVKKQKVPVKFVTPAKHKQLSGQSEKAGAELYQRRFQEWSKRLPLLSKGVQIANPTEFPTTWLGEKRDLDTGNFIGCGCIPCSHAMKGKDISNKFATFGVKMPTEMQFGHLARHAASTQHKRSVLTFVRIEVGPTQRPVSGAPSEDDFKRVWNASIKGDSFRDGITGVAHRQKCYKMQFCVYEAMGAVDRKRIQNATCIALQRDACRGRLVVRFRCASDDLEFHQGFLGVAKNYGSGGKMIVKATQGIFETFATPWCGAPADLRPKSTPKMQVGVYNDLKQYDA